MALIAAAVVLLLSVPLIVQKLRAGPAPVPPRPTTVVDAETCTVQGKLSLRPLPNAEDPPLAVFAEGSTRVFIDDQPTFSGIEAPKHFRVGPHTLRVETNGATTVTARFVLEPWRPALLYLPFDETTGTLLLRFGAGCPDCQTSLAKQTLGLEKRRETPAELMREAARLLRENDWSDAGELLRGVPKTARKDRAFLLLFAAFFSEAGDPDAVDEAMNALAQTSMIDAQNALLTRLQELAVQERKRRDQVTLERWNKLTDRYGALVSRFEKQIGDLDERARRMERLSEQFTAAAERHEVGKQEELMRAAEQTVADLVDALRARAPADCAFQASVVATALQ